MYPSCQGTGVSRLQLRGISAISDLRPFRRKFPGCWRKGQASSVEQGPPASQRGTPLDALFEFPLQIWWGSKSNEEGSANGERELRRGTESKQIVVSGKSQCAEGLPCACTCLCRQHRVLSETMRSGLFSSGAQRSTGSPVCQDGGSCLRLGLPGCPHLCLHPGYSHVRDLLPSSHACPPLTEVSHCLGTGYTAGTPYKVPPTQSNTAPPPYSPSPNPYQTAMYPIRSAYPQQNLYAQVGTFLGPPLQGGEPPAGLGWGEQEREGETRVLASCPCRWRSNSPGVFSLLSSPEAPEGARHSLGHEKRWSTVHHLAPFLC